MKKHILFIMILFFINISLPADNSLPVLDAKVNFLSDAECFYITQAMWINEKISPLIMIFFNSDNKTFWRYVINVYDPVREIYTTLFEEQEKKNFYFKIFYYDNSKIAFIKKFINNPFDSNQYIVFYNRHNKKREIMLLKDAMKDINKKNNMLNRETKGRLCDCYKNRCLKIINSKIYLTTELKNKEKREDIIMENVTSAFMIAGTDLIVFLKNGDYYIYDIDLRKVLYKLNFIESYSKNKVKVINLLDFSYDGKYVLFETTGMYKGRNKKSVGILSTQIFK